MINGLGVLGWGVGGIEAEAAMLGQPVSMLIPLVVGVKLRAACAKAPRPPTWCSPSPRCCASTAWSANLSNIMGPGCRSAAGGSRNHREYVSGIWRYCGIFPIDKETLRYLKLTGRSEEQIALVEAYCARAGDVPRCEDAGSEILRTVEHGSFDRRAVSCGAETPAGSRGASKAGESFTVTQTHRFRAAGRSGHFRLAFLLRRKPHRPMDDSLLRRIGLRRPPGLLRSRPSPS